MVARVGQAALRAQRKAAEYELLMAQKRGLAAPPAADSAPTPVTVASLKEAVLEAFPGAVVVAERQRSKDDVFALLAESGRGDNAAPLPDLPPVTAHPHFRDINFCALCKAEGSGAGFSPSYSAKPMWLCEECMDGRARRFYPVHNGKLSKMEVSASIDAANAAGAYLDTIGKTDLATLTVDEYRAFARRLIAEYIKSMRRLTDVVFRD